MKVLQNYCFENRDVYAPDIEIAAMSQGSRVTQESGYITINKKDRALLPLSSFRLLVTMSSVCALGIQACKRMTKVNTGSLDVSIGI